MNVVYTASIGDTDQLKTPMYVDPAWQYVAFTDNPDVRSNVWDVRVVDAPQEPVERARLSRWYKMSGHELFPGVEYSLWLDAAFTLAASPRMVVDAMGDADMAAFLHPSRDNIEDEARRVVQLGYDTEDVVMRQVQHYRAEGFTWRSGITVGSFQMRRHSKRMARFLSTWRDQVRRWSWRDQLSVDYAAWVARIAIHYLPGNDRYANPYARWHPYDPPWMGAA